MVSAPSTNEPARFIAPRLTLLSLAKAPPEGTSAICGRGECGGADSTIDGVEHCTFAAAGQFKAQMRYASINP